MLLSNSKVFQVEIPHCLLVIEARLSIASHLYRDLPALESCEYRHPVIV